MKSSFSALINPDSKKKNVQGWNPVEFQVPQTQRSTVTVDQVLDLFMGDTSSSRRQTKIGTDKERALFSALETTDVGSWNPAEIHEVQRKPFNQHSLPSTQTVNWRNFNRGDYQQSNGMHFQSGISGGAGKTATPIEKAKKEAERILEEARQQAEEMLAEAEAESQNIVSQAHEQIHEAYEQAQQMGYQEVEEETRTILQTVNTMVEQVSAWKEEMLQQSSPMIIDVIHDIAQSLFGNGMVLNDEALQQNLNRIMENAKNLGNLKVYLSPVDAGQLDPYWREFQASMTGSKVQIVPSEGITPGGCFIHGEMGSVDARIETQFRTIMETLRAEPAQEEFS